MYTLATASAVLRHKSRYIIIFYTLATATAVLRQ